MAVKVMLKRDMRSTSDKEDSNLFSGFLFCGDCGATMIRKTVPSKNKKYIYYICSANKRHKNCSSHSISATKVEEKVFTAIHDQVELVINLENALELIADLPHQDRRVWSFETQITKLEEEIERYQKLKLRLYEDFTNEVLDKSEYFDFRSRYTNVIDEKQQAIKRLKKELVRAVDTGTTTKNWVTLFQQHENIEELNRRSLISLVDRILIYENHTIEIVFKYKDEYMQTLEYVMSFSEETKVAV